MANSNEQFENLMIEALNAKSPAVTTMVLEEMLYTLVGPEVYDMRRRQYKWRQGKGWRYWAYAKTFAVSGVSILLMSYGGMITTIAAMISAVFVYDFFARRGETNVNG